jgi:hypothetical protein
VDLPFCNGLLIRRSVAEGNTMHCRDTQIGLRLPQSALHHASTNIKTDRRRGMLVNQRVRGIQRDLKLPFMPPEDWHEPKENGGGYQIIVQEPGIGYRHVLSADDIQARLSQLPPQFLRGLEVVQLSRMTRKKQGFPCYGIQWGAAIYLYPIEIDLVERHRAPPTPRQLTEARMYGGQWQQESARLWKLVWTPETLRDFYLNNILIHELGHLVDSRNTRYADRERYADWFALEYGYKRTTRADGTRPAISTLRHGRDGKARRLRA